MLVVNMPDQILATDSLATAKLCVTSQKSVKNDVRHTTLGISDADAFGAHEGSDEFCT